MASTQRDSSTLLLKTCQTCFQAKIKCERSQESGKCDRCLRLGKACVFNPSRRKRAAQAGPSKRLATSPRGTSRSLSISAVPSTDARVVIDADASINPFTRGILSLEKGQELLDLYRNKMFHYFPFVVVPSTDTSHHVACEKPSLCVAILSAASHQDPKLQRTLCELFNEILAARIIEGRFATLELLQGLLVHLAWAHYQQHTMRYSQHLSLANSIVSDLRLDRSRIASLWRLNRDNDKLSETMSHDEMRALAGAYYLSSCSSVLLQKSLHFKYTPFILECCRRLSTRSSLPTDKHLSFIIYLQKLTGEVDEAVSILTGPQSHRKLPEELHRIKQRYINTKQSLPFPLSESPTILLQYHVLELLICQPTSNTISLGINSIQSPLTPADQNCLLDWLSQSMSAAKALINVVLVLQPGEEGAMPNLGWVTLYSAASLAVRLDLVAAQPEICQTAGHLRRILDMPHTLRQIVLRMEATSVSGPDDEEDGFQNLIRRSRRIEEWYLKRAVQANDSSEVGSIFSSSVSLPSNFHPGIAPSSFAESGIAMPGLQVTSESDEGWATSMLQELDSETDLGGIFFSGLFDTMGQFEFLGGQQQQQQHPFY